MPVDKEQNIEQQEQAENQTQINSEPKIAEIRKSIEDRYEKKFAKAEIQYREQIVALEAELDFNKNKLPQIEKSFSANGGNKDYFSDFMKIAKDKINFDDLDKSMKEIKDTHKWAFGNSQSSSVQEQLNNGAGLKRRSEAFDINDLEPGTPYRKRTLRK